MRSHAQPFATVDFKAAETGWSRRVLLNQVLGAILARAGLKGRRHEKTPVFFAQDPKCPPTLQQVDNKGRLRNSYKRRGNTKRRVIVGEAWMREHVPDLWAALIGARLLDSEIKLPPQLSRDK